MCLFGGGGWGGIGGSSQTCFFIVATEEESVQSPLPSPVESTSTTAVISQAYNFILDNKPEMISGTNQ